MKKSVKIIIITLVVIISLVVVWFLVLPFLILTHIFLGSISNDWPSECGSGFEIVYNDPTKHNPTKIREAIASKAPEMIEGFHGAHGNWWDYVDVSEPDEEGIVSIGVPGIFKSDRDNQNYDLLIESLMELEGVSEIKPGETWCY